MRCHDVAGQSFDQTGGHAMKTAQGIVILVASAVCAACTSAPVSKETVQQGTTPPFLEITDKDERCFEMRSGTDQPATTVCPFVDTTPIFEGEQ